MLSPWQLRSFYFPTDVAIIGGGLTGLLNAILLKRKSPAVSVRVLERDVYPSGASVKNAGFACYGSVSEILNDIESEGEETAVGRVKKRNEGLLLLKKLIGEDEIGYEADGGYEVFTEKERAIYEESLDAIPYLNSLLASELGFEPYREVPNSFGFKCLPRMIGIQGEAAVDSGKLMKVLLQKARAENVELSFGCDVQSIVRAGAGWKIKIAGGDFVAGKVVVATNGFTQKLLPNQPVLPCRGQVLLTSPLPDFKLKGTFHLNQGYYYFRSYRGGIMLGGGRHLDRENEITEVQEPNEKIQAALEDLLRSTIIPGVDFQIEQRWAGILGYGPQNEKEAIVGEVKPGLFTGTRLAGMGIAMAPIVARELSKQVAEA